MDAIAAKSTGQSTIESYRQTILDMNAWFDALIKKIDVIDIGSGLNCAQKLAAISDIQNEFDKYGPQKLAELKQKAQQVTQIISNLDAQQVEEQLKSVDRRYNDISKRIARKTQMLESASKAVEAVRNEIEQLDNWLKEQIAKVQLPQAFGFESNLLDERLQKLKTLTKDAEAKQALADTLERRVANMHNDLEPLEQSQLESDLRGVAAKQAELSNLLRSEVGSVTDAAQALKKFESELEKVKGWLKSKLNDVKKQSGAMPLHSTALEYEIQTAKNGETDIKKFGDSTLNELQKKGQNILKNCSDGDKERLEKVLVEVNDEFVVLKNEAANKTKLLNELLEQRKAFEDEIEKLDSWINEVEVSTSSELLIKNLPLLEDQLVKFEALDKEKKAMSPLLASVTDRSKAILPTLNNADKMKLNEQIKTLKDKYHKPTISDRIKTIQDHIKRYKESKAKLADCVERFNKLKQDIRELNKPVGSKIDDVKILIDAHDRILGDLNENKNKINDIQIDELPELQAILSQHDDTIKLVEKQIANLRQLLLSREQYYALINQINQFIDKYTTIISEIEKSPDSIEEKIKQYDNVTSKIQECEGLLASVHDKGDKIASEGTVSDGNQITEQIQSLKQQLQNLRRQVETQRQQNELILAEHKKVANDLSTLLDWLHNNEAVCKSRPLLERDPDSVEREISKHNTFATDVQSHLDQVQSIDEQIDSDNGIPVSVIEMLSEGRSLLATLPKELKEREKYLIDSKQHRIDYIKLVAKFKDWLHQAESYLDNGQHGVDYANLVSDLERHKAFFDNDRPIKDLIAIEIEQTVDRIWPSLQSMEQDDLTQEVRKHKQSLQTTLNAAKKQRGQFEENLSDWNDYHDRLNSIRSILHAAQIEDEPVTSLAKLESNLQKAIEVLNHLKVSFFFIIHIFHFYQL